MLPERNTESAPAAEFNSNVADLARPPDVKQPGSMEDKHPESRPQIEPAQDETVSTSPHLRRRAYLSSRHRAILLAYEMDDQTATRFSVLAPHFKGEDLAFSESGGTLGPLASLAQSLRGGGP